MRVQKCIIGCSSAIQTSLIAFGLHNNSRIPPTLIPGHLILPRREVRLIHEKLIMIHNLTKFTFLQHKPLQFFFASYIFTLLAFNFAKFLHLLLFKELVDATKMFAHLSATKLVDTGYESVEEVTVVAHTNKCAIKVVESLL